MSSLRLAYRPRRPGFSLIEMVVSLSIVSILLVGMTSAVVLASRALPSNDTPAAATVDSARALHQLHDDLRAATELLNRTATSVTLHLPDRNGDGQPEVITYAWAGNAGDPLIRTADGSTSLSVLDNIESFALAYTTTDQDLVFPGPPGSTSDEQLLSSFESATPGSHKLPDDDWIGAHIAPDLPGNTTNWRITRALFSGAKQGGSGSTITFELRDWAGNEPGSTVLESIELAESTLTGSFEWVEAVFTGDVTFSADQTASLVLANYGGGDAGNWQYDQNGPTPRNFYNSSDEGDTWEPDDGDNDNHLLHYVYGTYDLPSNDWTYTRQRITAVEVLLTHGGALATTHQLRIVLPNAPEAADALWIADFNADPTTLDSNGDGSPDWKNAGTFDPARLADERWEATDTLSSAPDSVALDEPLALDLWIQDTTDNANGGGMELWFDRGGGEHACVAIEVNLGTAGQAITVVHETADGGMVQWVNQTMAAGDPVHVALFADTTQDTVGVLIDGDLAGSFAYERSNSTSNTTLGSFVESNSSGVFIDHVRLATGGTATITPGAYTASTSAGASGTESSGSSSLTGDASDGSTDSAESSKTSSNWWESFFK